MSLNRWEFAAAALGLGLASVFVFSNVSGIGWALVAADLLWVLRRAEITERHDRPGRYTTVRGRLGVAKLALLTLIYGACVDGFFVIRHDLGGKTRAGAIADFALAGLCFTLLNEFKRSSDETLRWILGSRAERSVGAIVDMFKARGWLALHGYRRDWGDIDHILCGPTGVYAIETKSYGLRRADIRQTVSNAVWLRQRLGARWVTGVLCVDGDQRPAQHDNVWVVGRNYLASFLDTQRHAGFDPEAARRILENPEGDEPDTSVELATT